jgi:hypothetical protein
MNDNLNVFKAWFYITNEKTIDFILVDNILRKSFDDIFEFTPTEEDFFLWFKFVNKDLHNIPSKEEVREYFNEIYK